MIVRARTWPEMEVRDSWNDSGSVSLLLLRSRRFISDVFALASLVFFRPIPTCFHAPVRSPAAAHSLPICPFSRNSLVTFNRRRVIAREWIALQHTRIVTWISLREQVRINYSRTRARGDVLFFSLFLFALRFMPSYVTKESVENFIKGSSCALRTYSSHLGLW